MTTLNQEQWGNFLAAHPDYHVLQSPEWGKLKSGFGWKTERIVHDTAGAQILFKRLPLGFSIGYIAKGPIGRPTDDFWREVRLAALAYRAIFLKVEPDLSLDSQIQGNVVPASSIQPRRTILIDLQGSEDTWLARMKQKTRYNIRLAEKKGVVIRETTDIDEFYSLMKETGARDGFGVHSKDYYCQAYELFKPTGNTAILTAYYADTPLAALMLFSQGNRCWYFYGASTERERNRMPAYLLQFEAMRWAKAKGCSEYDLWGIPDADEAELESNFESRSDGLWGVYRFKRGFGGHIHRYEPAVDLVLNQMLYKLYLIYSRRRQEAG